MTDRIVVVDTETTGVHNSDRILEVAVVTMDLSGRVIDEWDTLVDAGRDVGPTWIHGISPSMLAGAPVFADIASDLAARLNGAIVCAHNLPFDIRMLTQEYDRQSVEVTFTPGLDTLAVTRCKLSVACSEVGIPLDGAHQALTDARATARLLLAVADQMGDAAPTRFYGTVDTPPGARLCRDATAAVVVAPPGYLAELISRVSHRADSGSLAAYLDLLDRAMGDLHLDDAERNALTLLARDLGLDDRYIEHAHARWLDDLIDEAGADGVVDASEYDELLRAAYVLGVDADRVHGRTTSQRSAATVVSLEPGTGVCFTGIAVDAQGEEIPRSLLEEHAVGLGLRVEESFTRSRCGLLVAGDVDTRSGKASKARGWGIPVASAAEFLAATTCSSVTCWQVNVGGLQALQCATCGTVFTQAGRAGSKTPQCPDCVAT
ncbi:MAG: exonuclease domain-containing protein [Acidimicrobiia bacterium]